MCPVTRLCSSADVKIAFASGGNLNWQLYPIKSYTTRTWQLRKLQTKREISCIHYQLLTDNLLMNSYRIYS
jgi:hypothetical protein